MPKMMILATATTLLSLAQAAPAVSDFAGIGTAAGTFGLLIWIVKSQAEDRKEDRKAWQDALKAITDQQAQLTTSVRELITEIRLERRP
jgi:hypothetical protein